MVRLLAGALLGLVLGVAGCESGDAISEHISERIAPQPKTQTFDGDQRVVFDAAVAAVKAIDFRVTKAGAAQGLVQGISDIMGANTAGGARQFTIEVRVRSYDAKTSEVAVLLRIQEESQAFSGATDLPLKDHALYESFFEALQQALKGQGKTGSTPADSAK